MKSIYIYILIWLLPLNIFAQSAELFSLTDKDYRYQVDFAEVLNGRVIFPFNFYNSKPSIIYSAKLDGSDKQEIVQAKNMHGFRRAGKFCFFLIYDYSTQMQTLWRTDGTKSGTTALKTVSYYENSVSFATSVDTKNHLYFYANSNTNKRQFWRSDGTEEGTILLKQFAEKTFFQSAIGNDKHIFFALKNDLNKEGAELWKSDGTPNGTFKVKDFINIAPFVDSRNNKVAGFIDTTLLFSAFTTENGYELWKSNGTAAGTQLVKDLNTGTDPESGKPSGTNPQIIGKIGDKIYFNSYQGKYIGGIGRSDGTEAGTEIIKTLAVDSWYKYFFLDHAFIAGDKICVNAISDSTGWELFFTDTSRDKKFYPVDIWKGFASGVLSNPYAKNTSGKLIYFVGNNGKNGNELWRSDGTNAGTFMIDERIPGMQSGNHQVVFQRNDTLVYFIQKENTITLFAIVNAAKILPKQIPEPAKTVEWFTSFGGDFSLGSVASCTNEALRLDKDKNLYILGSSQSSIVRFYDTSFISFGPKISTPYWSHNFITKLNNYGKLLWCEPVGGEAFGHNADLITDNDNNIYVCGAFSKEAQLGNEIVKSSQSAIYLTKLDAEGNKIWHTSAWAPSWMKVEKLHLSNNNIFLGGSYEQFSSNWQNFRLISDTSQASYLVSFDTAGKVLWNRNLHTEWNFKSTVTDIKSDKQGRIYVLLSMGTRNTSSSCRFTNWYFKIFCLDRKTGGTIWEKLFESTDQLVASTLEISSLGELMVAGNFRGELFADDIILRTDKTETCNLTTSFFLRLDAYGKVISANTENPQQTDIYQLLAMEDGTYYETGIKTFNKADRYRGYDFGTPSGAKRVYVRHRNATGKILAEREFYRYEIDNFDYEPRIAVDKESNIYLSDLKSYGLDTIAKSYEGTSPNQNIYVMKFKFDEKYYRGKESASKTIEELITLGPNPTHNYLYITSTKNAFNQYSGALYNTIGQQITQFKKEEEKQTYRLDMSHLSPGVYILQLENGSEKISRKIVKQ